MIETKNLVPEVYYNRSRDFQLLGRTYDIIFNYLKTNIDTIYNNPYSENLDNKLISLVAATLGFKEIHEYNTKQLKALCSAFSYFLLNKGTKKSIQDLLNLILNVENTQDQKQQEIVVEEEDHLVIVYIPTDIPDLSLFEDVLTYILPAGVSYRIIREIVISAEDVETNLAVGNERNILRILSGSQFRASQVTSTIQDTHSDNHSQMIRSTDSGIGRIEDMTVVIPETYESDKLEQENKEEYPADENNHE